MLAEFKNHIKATFPFLADAPVLLAVSGGLDSMVLANLAKMLGWQFAVAHCNFKLRETASDLDEAFVADWCNSHEVPYFAKTFDLREHKGSIQLEARKVRYAWFLELMQGGYRYLATAHHLDDAIETFLINLSRGTGIDGLTSIPEINGSIVRPLLPFSKDSLEAFAKKQGIKWREDASNSSRDYQRNKMRHDVVPKLKENTPNFALNFQKTQSFLGLSALMLDNYADDLKKRFLLPKDDGFTISIEALKELSPLEGYLHLLFKSFGFTQWKDLQNLLDAQSGKEVHSPTHRLIKDREFLLLVPIMASSQVVYSIPDSEDNIHQPIALSFEEVSGIEKRNERTIYVDKETLNYPLKLRKWKIGDYFYPLGMQGSKKVAKFFKDEKLNTLEKESQWLLCSGDAIIWIVGRRLDDRFKVGPTTQKILKCTWH